MSTTPNYNLTVYPADDITTKFYNYRTATSGDTASSNFMIIDTALKGLQDGIDALESKPGLVQVVGTGTNSYTATVSDFTYITGQSIILSVSTANTGASTLDINSLGVRPLMKYNTAGTMVQLDAGDLRANNLYLFTNRNNNWILVGVSGANNINVSGNSGDILTVSDDNTIESSDLKVDEIARSVNRSFTAGASMAQSVICGLNENNLWVPLRSNYSFPIGTMVGITDSTTTLNAEASITITGYTPFLSDGLTLNPSPLQTDAVVFMKGSINDSGDFVPADTLTNILEPSASYLEIGYIVSNYNMVLSEKHTVYTLDADGNISSIDNIPIGGAGSGGQTVQTFSIGDGSTTVFTLNHGGNTQYVQLLVRTTATPHTYLVPDWAVVDNNNIQLTFDTAPSANEYQAIVYVLEPKVSNAFYKQTIGDGTNTEYYIHHNLGIEAPTVKLKQLSDNSYVYSGIFMEDENGDASQNVIKLTFYQPIPVGAIDVYVENNFTEIEGTQILGGQPAGAYEYRELVYQNDTGLPLNQKAQFAASIGDVIEIEYNYTSRPYPAQDNPSIYDTTFFRFRVNGGWTALWPSGSATIKAYQINGDNDDDVIEIQAYARTDTQGLSIMSRYQAPPSGFVGNITDSQLFRLKRVWKIHNV